VEEVTKMMGIDDVAEALTLANSTVRKMLANGTIPSARIGKRRLIKASDVETYINSLYADQGASSQPQAGW
jgi:excisionase family DNA binding protein